MSAPKRKAAAQLFREQNVQNIMQESEIMLEDAFDATASLDSPAPAPMRGGASMRRAPSKPAPPPMDDSIKTSEELQLEKEPIKVRETGFLWLRWVIVPPNVYVVHTRSGRRDPVTIGLGESFRYRPLTDAYLVVPAAMQTIGVVANCISSEKQGVNILAYVQWQIADFSLAYKKLDFSESRDPLGIVNAQLREQAEAAIKDKISTMSIEEVLTDKAPIIEELTTRLKVVAEGRTGGDDTVAGEGLGIKIVTVQIKEAIISSQRLWENLQAPFRHEQERSARLSHLNMERDIHQRELETRQTREISEADAKSAIERSQQGSQTEAAQVRLEEEAKRHQLEVENEVIRLEEQARLEDAKLEADRLTWERSSERQQIQSRIQLEHEQQQAQLALAQLEAALERRRTEASADVEIGQQQLSLREEQIALSRLQQEVDNMISEGQISRRLIDELPNLMQNMPQPDEMHVIQTGEGVSSIATLLATIRALTDAVGLRSSSNGTEGDGSNLN